MATGHLLPGYGDPISQLRRAQSAGYPLDKQTLLRIAQNTRLQREEIENIRDNARRLWSYPQTEETSYDNHYVERPADEMIGLRPTSSTRRNKPHPIPTFLTNRLHYIPGYHNADTTVGREAYRVDASIPVEERDDRLAVRGKYIGRVNGTTVHLYKDPFGLKQQLDGRSAQAADAWLRIADDQDRDNVMNAVNNFKEEERCRDERQGLRDSPRAATAYPSVHRWMRYAGAREAGSVGRMLQTLESDPDRGYVAPNPYHARPVSQTSLLSLRKRDIAATANVRFQSRPSRGDFLMHPDWPPSIPHHRVP